MPVLGLGIFAEYMYSARGNFRVKYQESSIGLENLSHLQFIENKCNSQNDQQTLFIGTFRENPTKLPSLIAEVLRKENLVTRIM